MASTETEQWQWTAQTYITFYINESAGSRKQAAKAQQVILSIQEIVRKQTYKPSSPNAALSTSSSLSDANCDLFPSYKPKDTRQKVPAPAYVSEGRSQEA